MDEYSFISENGTVRQIRDLIAKAKDEEQDTRLDGFDVKLSGITDTVKNYVDGKIDITPYHSFDCPNERNLLKCILDFARNQGYSKDRQNLLFIPGDWYGHQYGISFVKNMPSVDYTQVVFIGIFSIFSGIFNFFDDSFYTGSTIQGQLIT